MGVMKKRTIYKADIEKEPCGWCANRIHAGALYVKHLKKHQCVEKNCKYLRKNTEHQFWRQEETRKQKAKLGRTLRKAYLESLISLQQYKDLGQRLKETHNLTAFEQELKSYIGDL